jgi:HAD superfamily hydrolase (TIGR01459 family)
MQPSVPRAIPGLNDVLAGIDLVVLDLWGCLHDGIRCYPEALVCLHRLRELGRPIALLSNAPRRKAAVAERIVDLGITPDLYAGLFCSGEETWRRLHDRAEAEYAALGRCFFPLMAGRDRSLLDGLNLIEAADIAKADFLLATGVEGPENALAEFEPVLRLAAGRDLPMVCANPDLVVHRGGIAELCAGALARRYEEVGGKVLYEGKPYAGIYRRMMDELAIRDPQRILCVGDSLRTDIAGAGAIGAKSLLIGGGIHAQDLLSGLSLDLTALARLVGAGPQPDFVLPYLRW